MTAVQQEAAQAPSPSAVRLNLATPPSRAEPAVSRRAVWIGMLLVVFVAAAAPYNDHLVQGNSPFNGNHLPIGIMTIFFAMVLLVNPALRWLKLRAFSTGEQIVILTMMLVGAAVPSSGLMRYLEPMIVSPYKIIEKTTYLKEVTDLLPSWLVPSTDSSSPIIQNYWQGIDPVVGGNTPMVAFILPQLFWGILVAAILGGFAFLAAIFRKQWVHHERLTYPLATLPLELMAAPEAGRLYNNRWRNPLLWTGAAIPLFVYLLAGLHKQFHGVPMIDLQYNLREAFNVRPWDALPPHIYQARLYFAAIGICFFVPSEVAFSLWLFVVLDGLARVFFSRTSVSFQEHADARSMGTYVTYFAGLLWLARGHLKHVMMAAWRKAPRAEDEPVSYRTMLVGWLVCSVVAWVWLMAVGMNWLVALILLGVGTMLAVLMTRIVAETGLFFVNVNFWPRDFLGSLFGHGWIGKPSYLWSEMMSGVFYADFRENLMPYAANSLRMGQELPETKEGDAAPVKSKSAPRVRWFKWLAVALLVSAVVSGLMNHYLSYHYGREGMNDSWASFRVPYDAMNNTYALDSESSRPDLKGNWEHAGIGGASALVLMAGRVLWAGWPLHPIGLVLMNSLAMHVLWFSIFIGWGAKRLLLRYGGAGAFKRARPFFIGLIVGEVMAAGIWMFIGLATNGAVTYSFFPS